MNFCLSIKTNFYLQVLFKLIKPVWLNLKPTIWAIAAGRLRYKSTVPTVLSSICNAGKKPAKQANKNYILGSYCPFKHFSWR